ncbi:MAG TPA: hypothetical protein VI756_23010 [Blastocatellia bacterium]
MLTPVLDKTLPAWRFTTFRPPHLLTRPIEEFFSGSLGDDFRALLAHFPKTYSIYLVGGVVRDLALRELKEINRPVGDVDLAVVGASSKAEVEAALGDLPRKVNRMGGLKIRVRKEGPVFDLWRVEDHLNVGESGPPFTIEKLLRYFLLDIDALAWDTANLNLYDYGGIASIEAERIDLLGTRGISAAMAPVQAAHIMAIAYSTGFKLSNRATALIRNAWQSSRRGEIISVLKDKQRGYPEEVLEWYRDTIENPRERSGA